MLEEKNNNIKNIQDNYEYDEKDEFQKTLKDKELDETEVVPVDERKETMHFPWSVAIVIGVLMVLIIACFIVVMVLEHDNPSTSSSNISADLGVKIFKFLYKIIAI